MPTTSAYATVFAVAFGITLVLTPIAGRIARTFGALAEPDERKVHKIPTPYLGGVSIAVGPRVSAMVEAATPGELRSLLEEFLAREAAA